MTTIFQKAYDKRPLNELLSQKITIDIVGKRCVYINNHRVQGGKPYVSEHHVKDSRETTIREVLEAFPSSIIESFLKERVSVAAYCAGLRGYRDCANEQQGGTE